jgi:hypothetical protein
MNNKFKTVSQVIEKLEELKNQYGDLDIFMDVDDTDWIIDSINYSTTYGEEKFISLISFE